LGRNAVEDPPQAGCLGRTAAAPWRISRRGWDSACDGRGGRGGYRIGPPSALRPRGSPRRHIATVPPPPASPQRARWPDTSCRPCRVLRVSGRHPNGPRRHRRLGRAASSPRDSTRPDRRSGHAQSPRFSDLIEEILDSTESVHRGSSEYDRRRFILSGLRPISCCCLGSKRGALTRAPIVIFLEGSLTGRLL
jgi:hypothetical protein